MALTICVWISAGLAAAGPFMEPVNLPFPATATAAQAAPQSSARLRVYVEDCDCFNEYLRDEISWVDFVRQPQDADVHLLSSERQTGGGGEELVLRFVGRGRFAGQDQELRVVSEPAESENLVRARVLRTVSVGLLHYVAREGLPAGLDVKVAGAPTEQPVIAPADDPWNLWVFEVSTGASLDAEESNREVQWDLDLTADRVTEAWKIAFGVELDEQREWFDLDEETPLEVRRTERSTQGFVARGLGPHWSVGIDGEVESSTFDNIRLAARTAPAVEFSIFPYRDYATRQLVVQYQLGVEHSRYYEVTLFDRLSETRGRHQLSTNLDQRQPWGSLEAGIEFSQYLHDFSKYRLEVDAEVSLNLVRGLAVEFEGRASRQRDQLSLPRRSATPEEVLLQLRELQSGYDVSFSMGISYSFGSLFNNVVNPRFGNRDDDDDDPD
jgi:hypothetical protein